MLHKNKTIKNLLNKNNNNKSSIKTVEYLIKSDLLANAKINKIFSLIWVLLNITTNLTNIYI